ncbi:MAG: MBL fold metallo-hydrolase [Proteobacteria bacterium]|nr:MBL fold metallo-hydrolase [Pseudomonadota bacterium]
MFRQGDANADAGLKALFGALFPSLMCRLPTGIIFAPVAYDARVRGVFARTMPITEDGSVSLIPTPGHACGHQSVLIEDECKSVCIVGDAAFSSDQIQTGEIGGIDESHS